MSLGKRSRPPPMKRTTSVSQIGPALYRSDPESHPMRIVYRHHNPHPTERQMVADADSALLVDTADFLRACGLCKRRLGPGRDTFIYRGDIAFCSLECREKQIHQDERKEKFLRQIIKPDPSPLSADYEATSKSETVVAA